jgi:hypothetical protein
MHIHIITLHFTLSTLLYSPFTLLYLVTAPTYQHKYFPRYEENKA